jgi:hypothetical protein
MANREKGSDRYALLTGLTQVEDGPAGRTLSVVACMKPPDGSVRDEAEVEGVFFVDPNGLSGGSSIICGRCGERHKLYSLLDAYGSRLLPTDVWGSGIDLAIGIDALTRNAVAWLRTPPVTNLRRKAS